MSSVLTHQRNTSVRSPLKKTSESAPPHPPFRRTCTLYHLYPWTTVPSSFITDYFPETVSSVLDRPSLQFSGPSPGCWRRTSSSDRDCPSSARPPEAAGTQWPTTRAGRLLLMHLRHHRYFFISEFELVETFRSLSLKCDNKAQFGDLTGNMLSDHKAIFRIYIYIYNILHNVQWTLLFYLKSPNLNCCAKCLFRLVWFLQYVIHQSDTC